MIVYFMLIKTMLFCPRGKIDVGFKTLLMFIVLFTKKEGMMKASDSTVIAKVSLFEAGNFSFIEKPAKGEASFCVSRLSQDQ